ncbi:Uncharacterized protein TCM_023763 [Theobroma cacao]|uniref:Uncharacterized protein n=1 Tax=Theobroma cacao TaxID=3641 RepID=A0A061EV87_THECC|nr:Uncharacterized protein TCM_023763 [Theobroma cacao]
MRKNTYLKIQRDITIKYVIINNQPVDSLPHNNIREAPYNTLYFDMVIRRMHTMTPAMCTMWGDAHELGEMGCLAMCTMWGDAHELDEMWSYTS